MIQNIFFKRKCKEHGQEVVVVCFYKQCQSNRLICPLCLKYHKDHFGGHFVGVNELNQKIISIQESSQKLVNEYMKIITITNSKVEKIVKLTSKKQEELIKYLIIEENIMQKNCQLHPENEIVFICRSNICICEKNLCINCLESHSKHLDLIKHRQILTRQVKGINLALNLIWNNLNLVQENIKKKTSFLQASIIRKYFITIEIFNGWTDQLINQNIPQFLSFIDQEDGLSNFFKKRTTLFQTIIKQIQKFLLVDFNLISRNYKIESHQLFNKGILNFNEGLQEFNKFHYQTALDLCEKSLNLNKFNPESIYLKGETLRSLSQFKQSFECYDQVLLIDDENTNAIFGKGEALRMQQQYEESIEWYDKALKIDNQHIKSLWAIGEILLVKLREALRMLNQYEQSINFYDRALQIDKKSIKVLWGKGDQKYLFIRREFTKFKLILRSNILLRQDPIDKKYIFALWSKGEVLRALNSFNEALILLYDKALLIDDQFLKALRSDVLLLVNQFRGAIKCYDKALAIDKQYKAALFGKGYALQLLKKYPESLQYYDFLLKIDEKYKAALCGKGQVLLSLIKYSESILWYDKALQIDKKYIEALWGKAEALRRLEKYDESIEYYDETLLINGQFVEALCGKGEELRLLSKYHEAIKWYDRALLIDKKYADALCGRTLSLNQLGESNKLKK